MALVTLKEGARDHHAYVIGAWVLAAAVLLYIPFAYDVGFAPGTIDKAFRISQLNDVVHVHGSDPRAQPRHRLLRAALARPLHVRRPRRLHHDRAGLRPRMELLHDAPDLGGAVLHGGIVVGVPGTAESVACTSRWSRCRSPTCSRRLC